MLLHNDSLSMRHQNPPVVGKPAYIFLGLRLIVHVNFMGSPFHFLLESSSSSSGLPLWDSAAGSAHNYSLEGAQ